MVARRPGKGWKTMPSSTLPIPGDVDSAVAELGIEVYRVTDQEIAGWCPAHYANTGKTNSRGDWSVLREDRITPRGDIISAGTHNCFSCGFRGSFVHLVAYVLKLPIGDAENWVRTRGGVERAKKVLARRSDSPTQLDTSKQINEASLALMELPPKEAISNRNLKYESVLHYGVVWEPEKELWVCPIRDPDTNKLLGWQEKNERFFRNFPNKVAKRRTLFGLNEFEGDTAILLESPLDVVRLHSAGISGGLASFGAEVSQEQMSLIMDHAEILISALDNDPAGDKMNRTIQKEYRGKGLVIRFLNYDGTAAKDIGEMTDEEIHKAVDTSIPSALMRF